MCDDMPAATSVESGAKAGRKLFALRWDGPPRAVP